MKRVLGRGCVFGMLGMRCSRVPALARAERVHGLADLRCKRARPQQRLHSDAWRRYGHVGTWLESQVSCLAEHVREMAEASRANTHSRASCVSHMAALPYGLLPHAQWKDGLIYLYIWLALQTITGVYTALLAMHSAAALPQVCTAYICMEADQAPWQRRPLVTPAQKCARSAAALRSGLLQASWPARARSQRLCFSITFSFQAYTGA